MPRITLPRVPRLAALLATAVLGLALAATASADSPPGRGPTRGLTPSPTAAPTPPAGDCAVVEVRQNGDRPPTRVCLNQAPTEAPTALAGNTFWYSQTSCPSWALKLYSDPNWSGNRICFWGYGTVNLEDYSFGYVPWRNWSNKISSYKTGDECGIFWDTHTGPSTRLLFYRGQLQSGLGSYWNDRISSISLSDAC